MRHERQRFRAMASEMLHRPAVLVHEHSKVEVDEHKSILSVLESVHDIAYADVSMYNVSVVAQIVGTYQNGVY